MAEEIKKILQEIVSNIDGLYCILFTDREGTPMLRINSDKAPEYTLKPGFISTFCVAIEEGAKLGLGTTRTLICSYSEHQIIQMNKISMIITFVSNEACNTGQILALEKVLDPIVSALIVTVVDS